MSTRRVFLWVALAIGLGGCSTGTQTLVDAKGTQVVCASPAGVLAGTRLACVSQCVLHGFKDPSQQVNTSDPALIAFAQVQTFKDEYENLVPEQCRPWITPP